MPNASKKAFVVRTLYVFKRILYIPPGKYMTQLPCIGLSWPLTKPPFGRCAIYFRNRVCDLENSKSIQHIPSGFLANLIIVHQAAVLLRRFDLLFTTLGGSHGQPKLKSEAFLQKSGALKSVMCHQNTPLATIGSEMEETWMDKMNRP